MARKLEFRQIDVSVRSALAAELFPSERKGLYFYTFSDGTAYVGKSVDLLRRHAEHLDEYKHREDFKGVTLERAYFLPLAADTGEKELDCLETEAIRQAEAAGYRLKNIQKVNLPGGTGDTVFVLAEGVTRRLPWNRAERSDELAPAVLGEPTTAQRKRYEQFWRVPGRNHCLTLRPVIFMRAQPRPRTPPVSTGRRMRIRLAMISLCSALRAGCSRRS